MQFLAATGGLSGIQSGISNMLTNLIAAVIIIIVAAVACVASYIIAKKRKNNMDAIDEIPYKNYSKFKRKDSVSYARFDDIVDFGFCGAIMTNNGERYVVGISVTGFDYDMASVDEKLQTMQGMIRLTSVLTGVGSSTQIRQVSRAVDLQSHIDQREEHKKTYQDKISALKAEMEQEQKNYAEVIDRMQEEDASLDELQRSLEEIVSRINYLSNEIRTCSWLTAEEEIMSEYMKSYSGQYMEPERTTTYYLDWRYDKLAFATHQLTKKEMQEEAKRKLYDRIQIVASALVGCNVRIHRLSAEELMMEEYIHFHPHSSNYLRSANLLESSLFHSFIQTDETLHDAHRQMVEQEKQEHMKKKIEGGNYDDYKQAHS